ncbi:hypothetical protein ACSBR2_029434 [Camellia fascicularis]
MALFTSFLYIICIINEQSSEKALKKEESSEEGRTKLSSPPSPGKFFFFLDTLEDLILYVEISKTSDKCYCANKSSPNMAYMRWMRLIHLSHHKITRRKCLCCKKCYHLVRHLLPNTPYWSSLGRCILGKILDNCCLLYNLFHRKYEMKLSLCSNLSAFMNNWMIMDEQPQFFHTGLNFLCIGHVVHHLIVFCSNHVCSLNDL